MGAVAAVPSSLTSAPAPAPCHGLDPAIFLKTALFGGMTDECRCVLTDRVEVRPVAAGQAVYRDQDSARELFILASGTLNVEKEGVVLASLQPADFFGELSFLDMQPRNNSVLATEDSVIYAIPYASLRSLYERNVRAYALIVMNLAREVSRRLRKADLMACGKLGCGSTR